jgi:hypothetical protein
LGGAIIAWLDMRNNNADIYAQRVDAMGIAQWTTNGIIVCNASGNQDEPKIISDGAGGAIIIWCDYRSGYGDIYAQRINSSGAAQWAANGLGICTASGHQESPRIASAGVGKAIITWSDRRSSNHQVFAQMVDLSGNVQWTANGVLVQSSWADLLLYPAIVSDGTGGAIIAWIEHYDDYGGFIVSQRLDMSGSILWSSTGLPIAIVDSYDYPQLISDDSGGALFLWYGSREETKGIYVRRITGSGDYCWPVEGVPIFEGTWYISRLRAEEDGSGEAIITWIDKRCGEWVYAHRTIFVTDVADESMAKTNLIQNYPNPFNPSTRILFEVDRTAMVSLKVYDLSGRLIRVLLEEIKSAGRHEAAWDGRNGRGELVASGIYFYQLAADAERYTRKMILIR